MDTMLVREFARRVGNTASPDVTALFSARYGSSNQRITETDGNAALSAALEQVARTTIVVDPTTLDPVS